MTGIALTILIIAVLLSGDLAWAALRDRRVRKLAMKRRQTLTGRYSLPPY